MSACKVIVVGAGASGLIAAGEAAKAGADTLLIESMGSAGRKLRISGKGRCNLTNTAEVSDFISHFGKDGRFLRQAFSSFFSSDLVGFFSEIGVDTVVERGGRVFPKSGQAQDIVDALTGWVVDCGVKVVTSKKAESLVVENGRIVGVKVMSRNKMKVLNADSVIVATGGLSYPGTGSTGDGYRFAESAGHRIIPLRPALVPLVTEGDTASRLQGLSLRNISVRVYINGKKRIEDFGEMLFTHFGLSGPVILSMSGRVVDALIKREAVEISIDLKPALDENKLDARLLREFDQNGKRRYKTFLKELLPSKLITVCMDETGIPADITCGRISSSDRRRLRTWLKDFRFSVKGYRPVEEAIVTAGGVDTKEIDPRTMSSRLVKGLYFAGEVIDLNADTGGFNLQAAFSTGWLAGRSAAM